MVLLSELEEKIGYRFQNQALLKQALTHSSYSNEFAMERISNNERLEFLGDAVLELIISESIYEKYTAMTEGELTRLRASMVCENTLAVHARELDFGTYLFLGKGEAATGGRNRSSILADVFEAIIGAIYLDGGFANAKGFIYKMLLTDIEHKKLFFDSKTILQELIQGEYRKKLHYEVLEETGPDHNKTFRVTAMMDDEYLEQGRGRTKKAAEQQAAYYSYLKLTSEETKESKHKEKN